MNIYVGNLPYRIKEAEIREIFGAFGDVTRVKIVKDRETNRSKGFGFVEMSDDEAAKKAMQELDGKEVGGRALKINEAKPRE